MDDMKRTSEYRRMLPFIAKASNDVGDDTQGEDIQALILALNSHKSSADHDSRYYTETEVGTLFTNHNSSGDHDGRYYTESEITSFLSDKADKTLTLTAGNGLTGGGTLEANRTFAVGAGTGITVNADDVAINLAANLTWTGNHTFSGSLTTGSIMPALSDVYDLGDYTKPWRKIWGSELSAVVFSQYEQVLLGGWLTISKGEGKLAAAVASTDTEIDLGAGTFATNDIIVFRGISSNGTPQVEYMKVGTLVSGTTYNVTRDLDGTGANNWPDGTVYGNWGQAGNGRVELNAYDEPRLSVHSHGAAIADFREQVRIGDLNGGWGYSSSVFGGAFGAYETGKANITIDPTNGIRIRNYDQDVIRLSGTEAYFENYIKTGIAGGILAANDKIRIDRNGISVTDFIEGIKFIETNEDGSEKYQIGYLSSYTEDSKNGVELSGGQTFTETLTASGWLVATNYSPDGIQSGATVIFLGTSSVGDRYISSSLTGLSASTTYNFSLKVSFNNLVRQNTGSAMTGDHLIIYIYNSSNAIIASKTYYISDSYGFSNQWYSFELATSADSGCYAKVAIEPDYLSGYVYNNITLHEATYTKVSTKSSLLLYDQKVTVVGSLISSSLIANSSNTITYTASGGHTFVGPVTGTGIVSSNGWTPATGTWTYASATTVTVPSGAAAIYKVGQGIKLTANGVVLHAYIVGVADTLLTTAGDALTNHTFSAISYTNTPSTAIGFPQWFNYSPTITATSGTPTCGYIIGFSINGKTVDYRGMIYISNANGATGSLLLTMPTTVYDDGNGSYNIGTSTNLSTLGMAFYTGGNSRLNIHRYDGTTFISSFASINFHVTYRLA